MKFLFCFLLYFPSFSQCLQLDILLVGDNSNSVHGYESYIQNAFSSFASKFDLSEDEVKIGVIHFSSYVTLTCPLTSDKDKLATALSINQFSSGQTNMMEAFYQCINEFMANGRFGYRKIVILISDGVPDNPEQVRVAAQQLRSAGISIYGLLVSSSYSDSEFMESISTYYLKTNYESLSTEIKRLNICL